MGNGTPATLHRGSVKDGTRSYYADNEKAIRVPIFGISKGVRKSCEGYKRRLIGRSETKEKMTQV